MIDTSVVISTTMALGKEVLSWKALPPISPFSHRRVPVTSKLATSAGHGNGNTDTDRFNSVLMAIQNLYQEIKSW